jgi:type IV secretion system protein VirB10
MFKGNQDKEIEADVEIAKQKQLRIEGERGAFNSDHQGKHLPAGAKTFLITILLCALSIGLVFIWKSYMRPPNKLANTQVTNLVRNTLPALVPVPQAIPNPEVTPASEPASIPAPFTEVPLSPNQALQVRRLSPALTAANTSSNRSAEVTSTNHNISSDQTDNELQNKLKPLRLNPAAAGRIANPDYLLTQGSMIDCQLETRMITTQPGMTSCYTTRNIYSTNGRVVLIDRGSKIVGNYQGGMQQGQARIFVLWSRIETPKGVIVNIDSPGTGSLGESGVGGTVDTHFWQRFGGATMMSLIGDLGQYAANQGKGGKKGNNTTIQFSNTTQGMQQAATEALRNSINIPPTLYKNQGERISIFIARDLDFSGVYDLTPR